jgi:hypothetical protein
VRRVLDAPGMAFTVRDRAICRAVYEHRVLTSWQIQRLCFPEARQDRLSSQCKLRLAMLYQHGYLHRTYQRTLPTEGRLPLVYYLDRRGAEELRAHVPDLRWTPFQRYQAQDWLAHALRTNDVRIAFEAAATRHGWPIVEWIGDHEFRAPGPPGQDARPTDRYDAVTITYRHTRRDGKVEIKEEARPIIPDGYFQLHAFEQRWHFFIEADLGTESAGGRWKQKVLAYVAWTAPRKHGDGTTAPSLYERRYQAKGSRVLTITTSDRRLANLKQATEDAGGRLRYCFTTFERLDTAADPLTDPIWAVATETGLHSLFKSQAG